MIINIYICELGIDHHSFLREFRKAQEPEVLKLIKKHRIQHMINGTLFAKYKKDGNRIKG